MSEVNTGDITDNGLYYSPITWTGGNASLGAWTRIDTPNCGTPPGTAPQKHSTTTIRIGNHSPASAVIRNGSLWTCRTVKVNINGTVIWDPGNNNIDTGDRTACEWIQLAVNGSTLTYKSSGRVWSTASVDPEFYYYPSLTVNAFGDVVMGFDGSGNQRFPSTFFAGKLGGESSATTFRTAYLLRSGDGPGDLDASPVRWGDYSSTTLDPNGNLSFWTIHQYGKGSSAYWGLHVGNVKPF